MTTHRAAKAARPEAKGMFRHVPGRATISWLEPQFDKRGGSVRTMQEMRGHGPEDLFLAPLSVKGWRLSIRPGMGLDAGAWVMGK